MNDQKSAIQPIGMVNVGARVPANLATEFERIAANEERTVSAEIRLLMRKRVEQEQHPEAA